MPLFTTTRCLAGWPIFYTTYHQEIDGQYRRCERAYVLRLHRRGIVVGRWHSHAQDEMAAIRAALCTGTTTVIGEDGTVIERFHKEMPVDVP